MKILANHVVCLGFIHKRRLEVKGGAREKEIPKKLCLKEFELKTNINKGIIPIFDNRVTSFVNSFSILWQ